MDNDLIKSLIDALEASTLTELEYSKDGVTLRLIKGSGPARAQASATAPARPEPVLPRPETPAPPSPVVAPLFGVVHLHRSPDAPPFVAAGQTVLAGQVLCLIEAMKVFTELRAEQNGTIAAILVDNGQEVEAGHGLFRWA